MGKPPGEPVDDWAPLPRRAGRRAATPGAPRPSPAQLVPMRAHPERPAWADTLGAVLVLVVAVLSLGFFLVFACDWRTPRQRLRDRYVEQMRATDDQGERARIRGEYEMELKRLPPDAP